MKNMWIILPVVVLFFGACHNDDPKKTETPTSGTINVSTDETLQPIADAEADVFNHVYSNAKINLLYKTETEAVRDLMNDTSKMIFIGRALTAKEVAYFESRQLHPVQNVVAIDALALIVHPKNPDTTLTYEQALNIFKGTTTDWNQVKGAKTGPLNLVFDSQGSGTVNYILTLIGRDALPKNAYASKSNRETVDYVATHEDAIGVVGWSWLSDSDDKTTKEYLSKIKVVALSPRKPELGKGFFKPYQQELSRATYPLARNVYVIERGRLAGLASGFAAFVYNDIGQTIILKAGLQPAQPPQRNVEMLNQRIKTN